VPGTRKRARLGHCQRHESKDPKWKKVISGAGFAIINTPGILLASIRAGVLTVTAADEIKTKLEQRRFKMKFDSFASLI